MSMLKFQKCRVSNETEWKHARKKCIDEYLMSSSKNPQSSECDISMMHEHIYIYYIINYISSHSSIYSQNFRNIRSERPPATGPKPPGWAWRHPERQHQLPRLPSLSRCLYSVMNGYEYLWVIISHYLLLFFNRYQMVPVVPRKGGGSFKDRKSVGGLKCHDFLFVSFSLCVSPSICSSIHLFMYFIYLSI